MSWHGGLLKPVTGWQCWGLMLFTFILGYLFGRRAV